MAIPNYHEMYKSFLEALKDKKEHNFQEVKTYVSEVMNISPEEKTELYKVVSNMYTTIG